MSDRSTISWTEATWNPVTGCTKVSSGCTHCYIDRTPPFRFAARRFTGDQVGATTGVQLHPSRLTVPLRWTRPRRVFAGSLADLFHADVPDAFLAQVFAVMAATPWHTYQVLTKRHHRMRAWLAGPGEHAVRAVLRGWGHEQGLRLTNSSVWFAGRELHQRIAWPLPNVWVGVTTETQTWADTRIPALLATPAAVRWVSAEPLLGPLTLHRWLPNGSGEGARWNPNPSFVTGPAPVLDWVVAGGESGPGARPMHPDWARILRDQCAAAGVAFHFKQHGEWAPGPDTGADPPEANGRRPRHPRLYLRPDGTQAVLGDGAGPGTRMDRIGRRAAGCVLDGVTHDAYPPTGLGGGLR